MVRQRGRGISGGAVWTYVVDDILFRVLLISAGRVDGADDVDLVVGQVVPVDIYYVVRVVYPESVTEKRETIES